MVTTTAPSLAPSVPGPCANAGTSLCTHKLFGCTTVDDETTRDCAVEGGVTLTILGRNMRDAEVTIVTITPISGGAAVQCVDVTISKVGSNEALTCTVPCATELHSWGANHSVTVVKLSTAATSVAGTLGYAAAWGNAGTICHVPSQNPHITSLEPKTVVHPNDWVTIVGRNFGAEQLVVCPRASVFFGNTDVTASVTIWTSTRIVFQIPAVSAETGENIEVSINYGALTVSHRGIALALPAAAPEWITAGIDPGTNDVQMTWNATESTFNGTSYILETADHISKFDTPASDVADVELSSVQAGSGGEYTMRLFTESELEAAQNYQLGSTIYYRVGAKSMLWPAPYFGHTRALQIAVPPPAVEIVPESAVQFITTNAERARVSITWKLLDLDNIGGADSSTLRYNVSLGHLSKMVLHQGTEEYTSELMDGVPFNTELTLSIFALTAREAGPIGTYETLVGAPSLSTTFGVHPPTRGECSFMYRYFYAILAHSLTRSP